MSEMWAVAVDPSGELQGKFQWVRDHSGDIMTFCSKWEAKKMGSEQEHDRPGQE